MDIALDVVSESEDDYFIIFSDSLSVLLSLHNMKVDNPLTLKTLKNIHDLRCARKTIHLCWVPSHIVIRGNEHYQQQKLNFNRNRLNLSDKSKSVSNLYVNLSIWIYFE